MTKEILPRACAIEQCSRMVKISTKIYCHSHDRRLQLYGHPLFWAGGIYGDSFELQFWSRVAITANTEKCWEWQGGRRTVSRASFVVETADGIMFV